MEVSRRTPHHSRLDQCEQDKATKDSQIRSLNEELVHQEELVTKLSKEKKQLAENRQKTEEELQTAEDKSNELLGHMITATVAVSLLIWLTLGFRESWIVFLAIPTTLFPTLACFYLYGYTLNRITLFALIFSIGILVDDAIVDTGVREDETVCGAAII